MAETPDLAAAASRFGSGGTRLGAEESDPPIAAVGSGFGAEEDSSGSSSWKESKSMEVRRILENDGDWTKCLPCGARRVSLESTVGIARDGSDGQRQIW